MIRSLTLSLLTFSFALTACSAISRRGEDKPTEQTVTPLDIPKDDGPTVTLVKKGTDQPVESKDMSDAALAKNKWAQTFPEEKTTEEPKAVAPVPKNLWGNSLKAEASDEAALDKGVWSYAGATGPEKWAGLNKDNQKCEDGRSQSPIDLKWHKPGSGDEVTFHYKPTAAHVMNNGHTVQISFDAGNTAQIHGREYDLVSAYFHSPSEHSLSGKKFPMEVQLVHKDAEGRWATIAVFLKERKESAWISQIWKAIPSEVNVESKEALTVQPIKMIPTANTHYAYSGSMSVPPCTEGVEWIVFNNPISISEEQIAAFKKLYPENARPQQALNGRKVSNY